MVLVIASNEDEMANIREVAMLLDVSRQTIMKYLDDGRFPNATKAEGETGAWNIPREDVEAIRQEMIADLRRKIDRLEHLAKLQ